MIAIIDYGFGNTGSIKNMLKKLGHESVITKDYEVLSKADKLILPGVGSFDSAMQALADCGLIDILNQLVLKDKKPILGICLGMQLMTKSSEEGKLNGFGWIDAETVKFDFDDNQYRIPHMGWNEVSVENASVITEGFDKTFRYYFVHSYYVKCKNQSDIILITDYCNPFVSGFKKDNIIGVQFHPEKSHRFGKKLLDNFARMEGIC